MGGLRAIAIAGVGLAVAGGAAAVLLWPSAPAVEEVPLFTVETAPLRREVPADGNLEAVKTTPILAPQEARMPLKVAWMVEPGSRVEAGDVLVRFDPDEMKERLVDGEVMTTQVRKQIGKERTTSAATQRRRDREASLAATEMQSASELDYENSDVFSRNEIIESRIDKELAAAKMDHAKAAKKIERSVSSGKLEVLRVQERQAELVVSRAEKALEHLEITAPNGGIVLLHEDWRGRKMSVGDTVWPGQKLAEIPEDEAMQARVYVLEADGGALEQGMSATVWLESQPDRAFEATIERVDTLAQPRIPEVPVQYFAVVLKLSETDRSIMKIGQRVRARIVLGEADGIAVPRQAVFFEGKKSFVYRRAADGGFDKVFVTLGGGTAGRVIVSEGLSDGDQIALREPSRVGDAGAEEGAAE